MDTQNLRYLFYFITLYCGFNFLLARNLTPLIPDTTIKNQKEWLILIYMAANNDLYPYASRNIKEAARNAPENAYVIIQTAEPGTKKTKRYLIEKNKAICLNIETDKLDSGATETLVDFITWSAKHYPSEYIMLDFWDHGTGCLDPEYRRSINPAELDRSRSYLALFEETRGVCFDETYGTYLTNQKIEEALNLACINLKKKIDIVGFDACLMSMIETAELIKNYAHFMVASQEVELGAGWRYDLVLNILNNRKTEPAELAKHITEAYQKAYSQITNDYTLSAIKLADITSLTAEINEFAKTLNCCLDIVKPAIIKKQLRNIKNMCCFDEPSYLDLKTFTLKAAYAIKDLATQENDLQSLAQILVLSTKKIAAIMNNLIISNKTGPNTNFANGLSIYLPEKIIHNSYKKQFYFTTQWGRFIEKYTS